MYNSSSSQAGDPKSKARVRYGLMKIRIGSNHILKFPDGVNRQMQVKDITRYRRAKTVAICLACKKTWSNEDELFAAHPEEVVLRRHQEAHPWGWFSDEEYVSPEQQQKLDEIAMRTQQPNAKELKEKDMTKVAKNPAHILGLMSDEEGETR